VNAICWRGVDALQPTENEEYWLSVVRPRELNRPNVILGKALCVHYAFGTQRTVLDKTNILNRYKLLTSVDALVVVARYKEDVRWVKDLEIPHLIYNKGEPLEDAENYQIIHRINYHGREADTYLAYIVEHYDSLPGRVIFCQGLPFDHSPGFLYALHPSIVSKYKPVQVLSYGYKAYKHSLPRETLLTSKNLWLDPDIPVHSEYLDASFLPESGRSDPGLVYIRNMFYRQLPCNKETLYEAAYEAFGAKTYSDKRTLFHHSAQFSVTRDVIREKPKSYYEGLLTRCNSHPAYAWMFELMWLAIFDSRRWE
jgi:hypothetical protein